MNKQIQKPADDVSQTLDEIKRLMDSPAPEFPKYRISDEVTLKDIFAAFAMHALLVNKACPPARLGAEAYINAERMLQARTGEDDAPALA